MKSSNDKKKPVTDHETARMTAEQIADDMMRYARQHPYRGELHALDKQEALRIWEQREGGNSRRVGTGEVRRRGQIAV